MCRSRVAVAIVCAAICAAGARPAAQRAAISVASSGGPASTVVLDVPTGQTRHISDEAADQAFFTSDGAVLVWHPSGAAQWRATVVDTGLHLTLPENFWSHGVVHPRELAVFGSVVGSPASIGRVDGAGLHVFPTCEPGSLAGVFDLVPDGSRLVVSCSGTPQRPTASIVQIDARTGLVLSRVDAPSAFAPLGVATTDADYLLALYEAAAIVVVRRRLSDHQVLATTVLPAPTTLLSRGNMLVANPGRRDRPALIRCSEASMLPSDYTCRVDALDAATLSILSTLQASGPLFPAVSFTADGSQALVAGPAIARLVDIATGQTTAAAPAPVNGFIIAAWGAEPQAPLLAPAVVAGANVALTWTLPTASAAATGYRLEAGSQPGAADILTMALGATPSFAAGGVPSGRYYVRIRALNGNGVSGPSNEVVVDVP